MTQLRSNGFTLSEHYLSGYITGATWSGFSGVLEISVPLPMKDIGSYETLLKKILQRHGGDFQNPKFTESTGIVLIRRKFESRGIYIVHKRTLNLGKRFPDLVAKDVLFDPEDGEY